VSDHEARPANNESPDLHVDDLLTDDEPSKARPRRAFRRWLIVLGVLVTALAVAVGSALVWGVGQLNAVKREPGLLPSDQPAQTTDLDQQPLNFLLLGSDSRGDDRGRSDVMMLAHLDPSRDRLYLISLPRDLWVPIPGHGTNKINAAYAFGGAPLAVRTVQNLLKIHIDHVALTDFDGFFNLIDDVGGVTVFNEIPSKNEDVVFPRGDLKLDGRTALLYVRERYDLPRGDFDRAERQRLVVKAIVDKLASSQTLTNPTKLLAVIGRLSKSVTLDDSLTNQRIIALVQTMQLTSDEVIDQFQVPVAGFGTSAAGASYVKPDNKRMAELAAALNSGQLSTYQP
jgi:LCP family protein required for cell wall assembly